jgi:serine protease AprX
MKRNNATTTRGATWGGRSRRRVAGTLIILSAAVPVLASTSIASAAAHDPTTDPNSMKALTDNIGAIDFWDQGFTGAGVDVAVIDTGVSPVEGLATTNKVIYGPDLSLESQAPNLTNLDTNGHGTFIAGVIAGKDSTLTAPYSAAPATAYRGIAPDARIVSLKVGVADGGVDVTQVIAAINWVIDHKNDNGMNIRVLNLSYGTDATQSADVDPLAFAVERAWNSGIAVVVAAGNSGFVKAKKGPSMASPAHDPFVIAVGGYDTNGTSDIKDDFIGSYSQGSCTAGGCRAPDLAAIGSHVQGLRVPNSFIDVNHPEGLRGQRFFRGSGTSEAAAMTSGAVALLLQKYPSLTPDQVKVMLNGSTTKMTGDRHVRGNGALSLSGLFSAKLSSDKPQKFAPATGTGSIENTRGGDHVSRNGVAITGEIDIFGKPVGAAAAGSSWSGGTWNGSTWSGSSWSGSSWSGSSWSGSSWSGSSWSGSSWSGSSWSGSSWSGSSWSGSSWSGSSWSGNDWATGSWS